MQLLPGTVYSGADSARMKPTTHFHLVQRCSILEALPPCLLYAITAFFQSRNRKTRQTKFDSHSSKVQLLQNVPLSISVFSYTNCTSQSSRQDSYFVFRRSWVQILAPITVVLTGVFRCFPQSLHATAGHHVRFLPHLFHYSPVILPFDATQSELLPASLNKRKINRTHT
jgi:hypothetical protein